MNSLLKSYALPAVLILGILAGTAWAEYSMGRSLFGPSGTPGFFTMDVYSSEQSQQFADIYSLAHIIHGMLFYGLLLLCFPRVPLRYRLVGAVLLEAGWEVLENSYIIIDRYREGTIAWGYVGDSIFNSLSDILMVIVGFFFAHRFGFWASVALIVACELFALWLVRDNLTLNILMLTYPIEAIKEWQLQIVPPR